MTEEITSIVYKEGKKYRMVREMEYFDSGDPDDPIGHRWLKTISSEELPNNENQELRNEIELLKERLNTLEGG